MLKNHVKFIWIIFFPIIFLVGNCFGQYCIGSTQYTLRDEKGRNMKKKHLKNLETLSIDGKERSMTKEEDQYSFFYSVKRGNRRRLLSFENKHLTFYFGYCNQIRDLTLKYKETKMKLIFDIGIMNSNFEIDSLPFQKGTFKLKSLNCTNSKNPPKVDNENQGFCRVSAENWEKISEEITEVKNDCCDGKPRFGYWY